MRHYDTASTEIMVSVVINVWGKDDPKSLKRSLSSIQNQRNRPKEVLVVIDGPVSSNLYQVIQDFISQAVFPVRTIKTEVSTGLWNARNIGIAATESEFIALHDADDVMHPDRLGMQLKQMRFEGIDILGSPVYEFDAVDEKIIGLRSLTKNRQIYQKMIWSNVINHSSVMLRKSAVSSVGGYRRVYLAEDYDLWLRLINQGRKFAITDFVLQAFSVDRNLNRRRGGLRFISSEFAIHRLVRNSKSLNWLKLWVRLLSRLAFRLGPGFMRQNHRQFFQTQRVQNSAHNLQEFLNQPPVNVSQNS